MVQKSAQQKGKWFYGRRQKSSGSPTKRSKRRRFIEKPEDRCEKHHAYRAKCGCGTR